MVKVCFKLELMETVTELLKIFEVFFSFRLVSLMKDFLASLEKAASDCRISRLGFEPETWSSTLFLYDHHMVIIMLIIIRMLWLAY